MAAAQIAASLASGGLAGALRGVAMSLKAVWAYLGPLTIMTLILEDLYFWMKGGDSLIGKLFDKVDTGINKSAQALGSTVGMMIASWDGFLAALSVTPSFIGMVFTMILNEIDGALSQVDGLIADKFEVLKAIAAQLPSAFALAAKQAGGALVDGIAYAVAAIQDLWDKMLAGLGLPSWVQDMLLGDASNAGGTRNKERVGQDNAANAEQRAADVAVYKAGSGWQSVLAADQSTANRDEASKRTAGARERIGAEFTAELENNPAWQKFLAAKQTYELNKLPSTTPGIPEGTPWKGMIESTQTASAPAHGNTTSVSHDSHDQVKIEVKIPAGTPAEIPGKTAAAVAKAIRKPDERAYIASLEQTAD